MIKAKQVFSSIFALISLSVCVHAQQDGFSLPISVEEAFDLASHLDDVFILDIRGETAFNEGHLAGANSVPINKINAKMAQLDRSKTLLVYSDDNPNTFACTKLWELGFRKIYVLQGGFKKWQESLLPISIQDGSQGSARTIDEEGHSFRPTLKNTSVFCESYGGSHKYEYLEQIEVTELSKGVLSLTVVIFITNPDKCTYGSVCPVYDDSPEHINAWIDWNGDEQYSVNEKVLDVALTGYIGINYLGTMSTSTVITVPDDAVNNTRIRVNLGWGYDPNDPCDLSWDWGDVVENDIVLSVDPPVIEDIVITGIPHAGYPITNDPSVSGSEKVMLETVVKKPEGYEITDITWAGDLKAGKGNPYEYIPEPGSHGNKLIVCNLKYKHEQSGKIGSTSFSKSFKLFFAKEGDDNDNKEPNWFEYWKRDGAVPGMDNAHYSRRISGYGRMSRTGKMTLGKSAAGTHYYSPIILKTHFGTESFGGPTVKGIDCAAEIVAHEKYHYWVDKQWKSGGDFHGKKDSDKGIIGLYHDDELPDTYESNTSHTKNTTTDTYDLENIKHKDYSRYGDQEYMAMRAGDNARGIPEKDWAYPGKQTESKAIPVYKSSSIFMNKAIDASLTGLIADAGIDINKNGKYEALECSVEIDVSSGGPMNILSILYDQHENEIGIYNEIHVLSEGKSQIICAFQGIDINANGNDGPFTLTFLLATESGDTLDYLDPAYVTQSYLSDDFEGKKLYFTGDFRENGIDSDTNGLIDTLFIEFDLYAEKSGAYLIEGGLYTKEGQSIGFYAYTSYLEAGINSATLKFNGLDINTKRSDGPYHLKYLGVSNADMNDFIYEAFSTIEYSYEEFEFSPLPLISFTGDFSHRISDIDADCVYDYLVVDAGISIADSGNVVIKALLEDAKGSEITWTENIQRFDSPGIQTISLYFNTLDIYENGSDGPYAVKNIYAYHTGDPSQSDYMSSAISTFDYSYKYFDSIPGGFETDIYASVCEGESYQIGDTSFTVEGKHTMVFPSEFGCDSVVNINLAVNPIPFVNLGEDRIIVDNASITLNGGNDFETYYWSNGKTNNSIELDSSLGIGNHTIILHVTDLHQCIGSDTIQVNVFSTTGMTHHGSEQNSLRVYPNPANEYVQIQANFVDEYADMYLYNETGKLIHQDRIFSETDQINRTLSLSSYANGLYLIKIVSKDVQYSSKFMKH